MGLSNTSMVVLNNGTVKACGMNGFGQLGLGNNTNPIDVLTLNTLLTNVSQVSCAESYSIFLLNDGTVRASGKNSYGQLGTDDALDSVVTDPKLISGLANVKQVVCGNNHTLFLLNDGTVKACGLNASGQLGMGDTTNLSIPTSIPNLTNVKQVAAGSGCSMFLLEDGTVKVCGINTYGKLGTGDTSNVRVPTLLNNLSNVKQIACGGNHTAFLLDDGTVMTCGYNITGQLGNGNTNNVSVPTLLNNVSNVSQVTCGFDHTAFLLNDGTVMTCGNNNVKQLGYSGVNSQATPKLISGLSDVKQINCEYYHTLFLLSDNTVKCCGFNVYGQLGTGDLSNVTSVLSFNGATNVKSLQSSTESITIITMVWDSTTCGVNASVNKDNPLLATSSNSNANGIKTDRPLGSGKYYMEFTVQTVGHGFIGICNENFATFGSSATDSWNSSNQKTYYLPDKKIYPGELVSGLESASGSTTDIVGIKIDTINKKISFSLNNTWGTEFALTGETFYPVLMNGATTSTSIVLANFGASAFKYAIPDGYGTVDGSNAIEQPTLAMIWDKTTCGSNATVDSTNPLQVTVVDSSSNAIKTNIPLGSGKYYMEFTFPKNAGALVGICNENYNTQIWEGNDFNSTNQIAMYNYGGKVYPSQVESGCGSGFTVNDTVSIKVDTIDKKITFAVNNVWGTTFDLPTGTKYYPLAYNGSSGSIIIANFGATPFAYSIPDGYMATNTGGITTETYGLLLKSGDKYYSVKEECYDNSTKTYTEITDITNDSFITYGFAIEDLIKDLTINDEIFKPIGKFTSFSLVSVEEKTSISLKARKTNTELTVGSSAFNSKVADTINFFKMTANVTNNSSIKIAISIDDGATWKTTDNYGLIWTDLTCTIPLKMYSDLTEEEKTTWEAAKLEIKEKGFDSTMVSTINFNTLNADSIMFAYALYQENYDDSCDNVSLAWEFNSKGTMIKMSTDEFRIALTDDNVIITPTSDQEMIKVNILNGLVDMGGSGTTEINPATSADIQNILSKGW